MPDDPIAKLLPCPFCGCADADLEDDGDNTFVQCQDCFASGPAAFLGCRDDEDDATIDLDDEAVTAWNRRAGSK